MLREAEEFAPHNLTPMLRILARPACDQPRNSNRDRVAHRTDNSVVTLLGLPPETCHGWGFDPTTTQSADYPCGIGSIAQRRYTYGTRTGTLLRGSTAPRPTPDTNRLSGSFRGTGITERSYRRPGRFRLITRVQETRYEPLT